MIFPTLIDKKFGYVNLNLEAQVWAQKHPDESLVDPKICEAMVLDVHKKYGIDFSYGGWMEDRSFLWHGSYLDTAKAYVHLGVDLNASLGTPVALDFDGVVVAIDDDYPEQGGWGPTVSVRHATEPVYVIYAHLDRELSCKLGDTLKKGDVFAKIGNAPYNGNWFPHVHVQIVAATYYEELEKTNQWGKLDGYGTFEKIEENAGLFTDPLRYISLTNSL